MTVVKCLGLGPALSRRFTALSHRGSRLNTHQTPGLSVTVAIAFPTSTKIGRRLAPRAGAVIHVFRDLNLGRAALRLAQASGFNTLSLDSR